MPNRIIIGSVRWRGGSVSVAQAQDKPLTKWHGWGTNQRRRTVAHALRFGVAYDFRNPPDSGIDNPSLYAAILDQVAWLDGLGLDLAWFTEHHFVDDGY